MGFSARTPHPSLCSNLSMIPASQSLVCHSPGLLRHVKYKGEPPVKGKHVTGFTNGEEEEVRLTHVVPFMVEDELLRLGAIF